MRKVYLRPKCVFEKHLLGAVGYWLVLLVFLFFIFARTNSLMGVCVFFLIVAVIPNGVAILKGPVWIIDQKQIRVWVQGKLVAALAKNNVTRVGICSLPNNTKKLWITTLQDHYFIKYLSRHERTARLLFSEKVFADMMQNEEGKLKLGISVYLHRNDCGKKDSMLFFTVEESDINKVRSIWNELLTLN